MKWFKHDSNALHDAKIEKLIMKFGIEGYGLYFACIEIIADKLTSDNITFELEHDAEILAYKFKLDTLKVEAIMKFCVNLGLFQYNVETQRIVCFNLAKRLDTSMSQNVEFKKIVTNPNFTHLIESNSSVKQKRREENTKEEKHKYGEYSHVLLTDIEYQKIQEKTGDVIGWIRKLDEYLQNTGKPYKDHHLTIMTWYRKDGKTAPAKLKSTLIPLDKVTEEEQAETARQATKLKNKLGEKDEIIF